MPRFVSFYFFLLLESIKKIEKIKLNLNYRYADSNDDSEDEGIKEYQVGGYHPVHLGEVLIDRYIII
jgi:serine/threonine-protein kinase SRPK3